MLKDALRVTGKRQRKVAVVFSTTRRAADLSVQHLREAIQLPIWVFSREEPSPEIAAQCERVIVEPRAARLWWRAQQELWPYWAALAVSDWTGNGGNWALKFAPFSIPPFRPLIMNESADFFSGSPGNVLHHAARRVREKRTSVLNRSVDIARGAGLFCFAFVAQGYSPLSRYAFRKLRREHTLEVNGAASTGQGIVRSEYKRREWDHHALAELLRESDARWILFERAGQHEPVEELIAPFAADPNTFAVGRQHGEREWRKLLFATAPFRALQRDEYTRVLAPVSPQMLVDRAKLAALGIPALSSFGSNWFLLFWKAAAAGWNSYNAGSGAEISDLPAVPYDEAEFVKTLLDRKSLRALAPRRTALSRGNIAQSSVPGPGFRGLPRVLVVSPYLPFPLSHGGAVRIFNLCRALGGRVDFVLACFREANDHPNYAKLHEVFREVFVVDIDEKNARSGDLPRQVTEYENSAMRALIGTLCQEKQISILQIEYTQMAAYREAAPSTPAILVEHDLTFTLYQQFAERDKRAAAQQEFQNWLRFERERLRAFDAVWTMSELDRERAIQEGSFRERTFSVPNGVDLRRFSCSAKVGGHDEIFYVGSFRHRPNYLGFEELQTTIMPMVWLEFPRARLNVVAGPDHLKHWPGAKAPDPRITVHGFVEDLLPFYREATLVVVPLPVSAGTNIKLMEALACERAVVSTPVGCAGLELIDGSDALIRDLGAPFAQAICDLLRDPPKRGEVAARGRTTAIERFSWESIAAKAFPNYEATLEANLFA